MRGDVFRLRSDRNAIDHEQKGPRYGIVVQSNDLPMSTMLVAPTSTSAHPTIYRPEVTVLGRTTLVQTDQTMAVALSRLGERVGALTFAELLDVNAALNLVLGLD